METKGSVQEKESFFKRKDIEISVKRYLQDALSAMALGLFAGMKCSRVLDEKWVRRLTSVLLVLSGVSLIAVNL